MNEIEIKCAKCGNTSGDNWADCVGDCPVAQSLHFNWRAAEKYGHGGPSPLSLDYSRGWNCAMLGIRVRENDFDSPQARMGYKQGQEEIILTGGIIPLYNGLTEKLYIQETKGLRPEEINA